ncbi:MAG: hypothetical protein Q4A37_01105 [Candidatus Saccharibacteria bacterium]|nr:hypothetical protein [Candidatus Saccharibacteria bacterium]
MNAIAEAIRQNSIKEYQRARYPDIQDGELVRFVEEDFSNVDFGLFPAGFFEFYNCSLDNSCGFHGQPITIIDSSARNIDFTGTKTILYAENCDFTGMKYNSETLLAYDSRTISIFTNCTIDPEAREFLMSQGVQIIDTILPQ